jgi:hypothetical protein
VIPIDITRISHCDHENCDLGQLEYDCPKCGEWSITTTGWYECGELEEFRLNCCQDVVKYNSDLHEWQVEEEKEISNE